MKYLSVCSGIEAATVAWHHMGWQPVAFSEIEPFPSAVLAHHYPNVPNVGDMTKFQEWNLEPIDLLVGGTPCQSFSVAGLRKGLADPRGNLMLTFLAIAERQRPKWVVWENVPGVLSSGGGRDFGTFLSALGELGYGWAYRVLDAQWFGVAQRRRRVFVVGCLGDQRSAAAVLFERESVCRNPAPSREKGKEVAGTIAARFGISRNNHEKCVAQTWSDEIAQCLTTGTGKRFNPETETLPVTFGAQHSRGSTDFDMVQTPQATNPMAVAQPVAFRDPCPTLTARMQGSSGWAPANEDAHLVGEVQPMAFEPSSIARNAGPSGESDLAPTLRKEMGDNQPAVRIDMQVRRLTPVECERLQGFPDGYTNIPWRKSDESPDGPRYKALGNSMAVPVMRWIGERINMVPK